MKNTIICKILTICIISAISFSCTNSPSTDSFSASIDSIAKKWVPDSREGICNIRLYDGDGTLILKGETNLPQAKSDIIRFLGDRKVPFIDSLALLPDTSVIREPWGLVTISVCNIRISPSQDAEMVSQSIMGTPVKIIKKLRGWLLIQTPDYYLGWTEGESVESMSAGEYNSWKSSPRLIYLDKTGDIFADIPGQRVVSDIVAGCILTGDGKEKNYQKVILPDGRTGYLPDKSCIDFKTWAGVAVPEKEEILQTSFRFMGAPYLWGGTSSKGMDCSGFVKTVYYLNGMVLARDVSLQYRHVMHMTPSAYPDSLRTGDLLFFGSVRDGKPRPTHVGIYAGNTEFIHCSGMVRVNSLDSARSNFSRYRRNTFLGAGRIIGQEPEEGTKLISDHSWYN